MGIIILIEAGQAHPQKPPTLLRSDRRPGTITERIMRDGDTMKVVRKIIKIDEELCDGCGQVL